MGHKALAERAQEYYDAVFDETLQHLMDVAEGVAQPNSRERREYGFDSDDPENWARERIEELCYGVGKETVYYVTLAGGGPAARLKVTLDDDGAVETAALQYQDWFEPWTDAPQQDSELVERYARLLGIGLWADGWERC